MKKINRLCVLLIKSSVVVGLVLLSLTTSTAAPGELDYTFGRDGKVTTQIGGMTFEGNDVAVQSDGKIIVAGRVATSLGADFAVVRYNTDGSLDTGFDSDGLVTTIINNNAYPLAYATAVVMQADGQILVAGTYTDDATGYNFAVVRYNPNGSLDASFDGDGIVTTDINLRNNFANAMALQSDGKIVVAGNASFVFSPANLGGGEIQQRDFAAVRYNSNGSLDTAFDGDGIATTDIGSFSDEVTAVAIQPDGKVLLAGFSDGGGTGRDFSLARFTSSGTADPTFDLDGQVTTSHSPNSDQANSLAMQSDGKIIVAGYAYFASTNTDIIVARYNSNGALDTTFDGDGVATTNISGSDAARAVRIQSDGKIIVAGDATGSDFAVLRYQPNGSLDTSWGTTGIVTTDFGTPTDIGKAMAIQADGKVVVAGNSSGSIAVARYKTSCDQAPYLDTTFGACGKVVTQVGINFDLGTDSALQADGKTVVAGYSLNAAGTSYDFAVVRYNPDGSLDTSFDADGRVITVVGPLFDVAYSVEIQTDGKIVVAGYVATDSNDPRVRDFAIVRYNANGSLDTGFDSDGIVTTSFGMRDEALSIALQSDGKIVAAGTTASESYSSIALARYNTDGSLDTNFDGDGKATTSIGSDALAEEVLIQPDGRILAAGGVMYNSSLYFTAAVVRYNPNGSLDTGFAAGGIAANTPSPGFSENLFNSLAVQTDGKIIAVGYAGSPGSDALIARFNPSGSLDTGFSDDGIVLTELETSSYDFFQSVAIQANGKIIAVGGVSDLHVVRFSPDGSYDSLWGTGGIVITDIASATDAPFSIKIQTDGKFVLAGYMQNTIQDGKFVAARYVADTAPTAALVAVSGRVTTADGAGVSRVRVSITDQRGDSRYALTSSFGYYRFEDVAAGETYIVQAASKRYHFAPRMVSVNDELRNVDLIAIP